jgi:hypothetical protein
MAHSSSDLSEDLKKFGEFFATQLTDPWTLTKNPPRLETHFRDAQLGNDETAKLFLQTGFVVWVAYFRTKQRCEGGHHYSGQKVDQETLSAFRQLCREEREAVATALSHTAVHLLFKPRRNTCRMWWKVSLVEENAHVRMIQNSHASHNSIP